MGYVRIIASRYLRSKRRLNFITLVSLLAIGGVFVGVAALTIVLSVMNGFEDQVQQHMRVVGESDIAPRGFATGILRRKRDPLPETVHVEADRDEGAVPA